MIEILRKLFSIFLLIYLFFTFDLAVLNALGVIPAVQLDIKSEILLILLAALYTLPMLVLHSKHEPSIGEMIVRRIFHVLSIEVIVIGYEFFFGGIRSLKPLAIIGVSVLGVYFMVCLADWLQGRNDAKKMNRLLAELKSGEK